MKKLIVILILAFTCSMVTAQRLQGISELNEKYTTGLFRTEDAHFLVPEFENAVGRWFNVFEYLQGKVPGLMVYTNRFRSHVVRYRSGQPAFYVDEMMVDAQTLGNIPMNDIAFVKVFRPPFMGAPFGGSNGAIAVYTKEGDEELE